MMYIIPEYFTDFKCKCGNCRHSCCEGWPIKISMKEYYKLLGINCSKKLRAKLDCTLKICQQPNPACYAELSNNWNGICMLQREDGLCSLHSELGENVLPEICRIYPRRLVQLSEINLCSCSNSCEEVIELLLSLKSPMQFDDSDISIIPKLEAKVSKDQFQDCKKAIYILQDRTQSISKRFFILGNFINGYEWYSKDTIDLSLAFQFLYSLDKVYENSSSVSDYCRSAENYFCIDRKDTLASEDLMLISERYASASKQLDMLLPEWQEIFEQLLVNHMFYSIFPYTESLNSKGDSYLSLVIIYSFLRINLLGFMSNIPNKDQLVDFFAAMFRLINHSNFDLTSVMLLKEISNHWNKPVQELVMQLLHV